ncbi:cold shock domain-containing protein [Thiomicrospira microaerophila]|uniref:cold shock domain-containing protein n=1 Tax=Thiomicrospira microaerophila TaxID=406020 RepID=UPI00200DE93A|nr:cold shock domain-containing protein [Thiomicrospira microaerophila]UQB41361.1 cold shock domain-containing protein [Thiomicrospira microaerophila]
MRGTIKFYNKKKGFGFINTDEHDKDIYFHIKNWEGAALPETNDSVEFDTELGKKGLQAIDVLCIHSAKQKLALQKAVSDGKISCPHCHMKMIPRINFYQGRPEASFCPYCGGKVKDFSEGCFIATAVYKDYSHPQVLVLRNFRDGCLKKYAWGRSFIAFYYKKSPAIAEKLIGMPTTSAITRYLLNTFIYIYNFFTKPNKN